MSRSRYLAPSIQELCFFTHKMAFISGPRQVGKTTMAKDLLAQRGVGEYYNWDEVTFRRAWTKDPMTLIIPPKSKITPIIVLDEIHKAKGWKRNLKGIYDSLPHPVDLLVTGSARLNIYRKGGDSLLGRYYNFRLHPFSVAELSKRSKDQITENWLDVLFTEKPKISTAVSENLENLYHFGPFPEPLFSASKRTLNLWRQGRIEKIIREDLRDLSRLTELSQVEMLASLLPERVSNPLSLRALSEDLEVSYLSAKLWLNYLCELYYCYTISPYSRSLKRAIKKEKKLYLWDWSEVEDEGARFENLIAGHLLKYCNFMTDNGYGKYELHFLKNKEGSEIDFLISENNKALIPVEVKLNDTSPSKNWSTWLNQLVCTRGIQVVKKSNIYAKYIIQNKEILVISADMFLNQLI